jgi:hypothetical protein
VKICVTGIFKAADARSVGPVQGRKLTPAASEAAQARMRRSMPSWSYSGSMAGMVIRKQTAPEPSRWISNANSAVPITMRVGRTPITRRMRAMIGSSIPASVMTPK